MSYQNALRSIGHALLRDGFAQDVQQIPVLDELQERTGTADGTSTVTGIGSTIFTAGSSTSTGSSTVSGSASEIAASGGTSAGSNTTTGAASEIAASGGSSSGSSTATADDTAIGTGTGSSSGSTGTSGSGSEIAAADGVAAGSSTAVGVLVQQAADGFAAGTCTVVGIGSIVTSFTVEPIDGADVEVLASRCDVATLPMMAAVQSTVSIVGAASAAYGDVELEDVAADVELITEAA